MVITLLVDPAVLQNEVHYRLSGFGQYDGLYPGGKHYESWPNGCDEEACPRFNPNVVPPRAGYEQKRFDIALKLVNAYLKDALMIASLSWTTDLNRAMARWRLDDATKYWGEYLEARKVEG